MFSLHKRLHYVVGTIICTITTPTEPIYVRTSDTIPFWSFPIPLWATWGNIQLYMETPNAIYTVCGVNVMIGQDDQDNLVTVEEHDHYHGRCSLTIVGSTPGQIYFSIELSEANIFDNGTYYITVFQLEWSHKCFTVYILGKLCFAKV